MHAAKLKEVYGEFSYAPYRTPFDPELETEQLKIFLPKYKPKIENQKSVGKAKTPVNTTKSSSSSSTDDGNKSAGKQKKRNRSSSRPRKSSSNEEKSMEGYGTDDDDEISLDCVKRNELLKSMGASETKQEQEVGKNDESTSASEETDDKKNSDEVKAEESNKAGRCLKILKFLCFFNNNNNNIYYTYIS